MYRKWPSAEPCTLAAWDTGCTTGGFPARQTSCFADSEPCASSGLLLARHTGCPYTTTPETQEEFWQAKFRATVARDSQN